MHSVPAGVLQKYLNVIKEKKRYKTAKMATKKFNAGMKAVRHTLIEPRICAATCKLNGNIVSATTLIHVELSLRLFVMSATENDRTGVHGRKRTQSTPTHTYPT